MIRTKHFLSQNYEPKIFVRFSEVRTYVRKAVDVIYTYKKRDILPAGLKEHTRIWSSDLKENALYFARKLKKIAICRGKREKSRLVAENGKNQNSAHAAIPFSPYPKFVLFQAGPRSAKTYLKFGQHH